MEHLSTDILKKLDSQLILVDRVLGIGNKALLKFPTDKYQLLTFTFINYLERFVHSFETLKILITSYKNQPRVETTIGLLLRTCLLDFMTITYLSSYQADIESEDDNFGNEKFDKVFDSLVADHLLNTIRYLKLAKDSHLISKDEYRKTLENLWITYSFLFKELKVDYINPETKLIASKYASPKELFSRINSHPLTKKYSKVYDLYQYYSKYDHFGIMTHFMQRQGSDNGFEIMTASMKYILRGIGACFAFLSGPNDILKEEKLMLLEIQEEYDKF